MSVVNIGIDITNNISTSIILTLHHDYLHLPHNHTIPHFPPLLCTALLYISPRGGDIAQMFRVQMDHIPVWWGPPSAAGEGYGIGTKNIIDFMADLHPSKYTRPHAWMDPDFLETLFLDKHMSDDVSVMMNYTNSRTEFSS
jgi:hypothetical protein